MPSEDRHRGMRRKGRGAGPEPPGGGAKYGDDEGGTLLELETKVHPKVRNHREGPY